MRKRILCLVMLFLFCIPAYAQAVSENSEYPYEVTVNATKNIVTVYAQDETGAYTVPEKAFVCSTGKYTPAGTFRTTDKYTWRLLFGDVYGQYATRIYKHILFHSVPYFEEDPSTLEYEEYNKLGTQASAGCIRLTVEDAKWIYDNCPAGTTVKIFGDKAEPLKPEQPEKIDVTNTLLRGWDPTDPDERNPWKDVNFRKLILEAESEKEIKAFYEKGTYFLSAADAKQIFAELGLELYVPETEEMLTEEKTTAQNLKIGDTVQYHAENGVVYYKLRDLAVEMETVINWDSEKMQILLMNGENIVCLQQTA